MTYFPVYEDVGCRSIMSQSIENYSLKSFWNQSLLIVSL